MPLHPPKWSRMVLASLQQQCSSGLSSSQWCRWFRSESGGKGIFRRCGLSRWFFRIGSWFARTVIRDKKLPGLPVWSSFSTSPRNAMHCLPQYKILSAQHLTMCRFSWILSNIWVFIRTSILTCRFSTDRWKSLAAMTALAWNQFFSWPSTIFCTLVHAVKGLFTSAPSWALFAANKAQNLQKPPCKTLL